MRVVDGQERKAARTKEILGLPMADGRRAELGYQGVSRRLGQEKGEVARSSRIVVILRFRLPVLFGCHGAFPSSSVRTASG
jgi:hypothetical protein